MSLQRESDFAVDGVDIDPMESGTSVLLTGENSKSLKRVFERLVSPADDERAIVLATEAGGRNVQRDLKRIRPGADDRTFVLTCEGPTSGEDIQSIDDLGDLTTLGMEFSALVAAAQQQSARFRSGIYLTSTVAGEVEDLRSLYRFLNANFLTDLRRGEGVGVCALDTSADFGSDVDSVLSGLKQSFSATVEVEETGRREATLDVSGLDVAPESVEVAF